MSRLQRHDIAVAIGATALLPQPSCHVFISTYVSPQSHHTLHHTLRRTLHRTQVNKLQQQLQQAEHEVETLTRMHADDVLQTRAHQLVHSQVQ